MTGTGCESANCGGALVGAVRFTFVGPVRVLASGGDDGIVRLWETRSGACLQALRSDRHYQRLDITSLSGVIEAQRAAVLALGAIETPESNAAPAMAR
jgi:WD40 repeat protein